MRNRSVSFDARVMLEVSVTVASGIDLSTWSFCFGVESAVGNAVTPTDL